MKRLPSLACLLLFPAFGLVAAPAISVDPAARAAPINPYIYGQFIEHLGRCIYGGIWAEMLEDRKFYFPVTADYSPYRDLKDSDHPVVGASPWQIAGAPDSVTMIRSGAFVGEHSPLIRAGSGLRQLDLGVRAGLAYDGYVWARPAGPAPATFEVSLIWGDGAPGRAAATFTVAPGDYSRRAFSFPVTAATDRARLEIRVITGDLVVGTASLMPSDNINGLRRDTLALLKQLNGSIYRWPGGNFVSGYNWRDGIGDRDRRPPRKNPAWTGVEHNDFGTDEFLAFCRELGAEPMIAVNTGFGDAFSAAQWVEYCNGSAATVAGGWRARNGHPGPYGVKHWCVGNEMFGPWQLGFMQVQHYVLKHNEVAAAMWQVDPGLSLAAVGDYAAINKDHDPEQVKSGKPWSLRMLEACSDHMTLLSEHFYDGRLPWNTEGRLDPVTHVARLKAKIKRAADYHRTVQASLPHLKGRIVPITMDEWNYWHREYVYGELGCIYDQADALGVAAGLHEYFRQTDIIHMAFYAQTVNVIGAIKTSKTAAEIETTGLVLQLYRAHFGTIPLKLAADFGPLDVAAALTADERTLTIGIVNPTNSAVTVPLTLPAGRAAAGRATRRVIAASSETAHNSPGRPRVVDIVETSGVDPAQPLVVPALGVALFSIPLD